MASSRSRVGLPAAVQERYRVLSVSGGRLLKDLHADAVRALVKVRRASQAGSALYPYLAAPLKSVNQNVDLPDELWTEVHELSTLDEVSSRRFVYTALVHYIDGQDSG